MTNDHRLVASGVAWNYLGSGTVLVAQILYTALTARLISPEGFGAYAAAQALFSLVSYLGLTTLGNAVIRHEGAGKHVAGTAFLLSGSAGALAALVLALVSPAWAGLWEIPDSESVGRLFALVVLMFTVSVVPLALLRKSLRYRRAALIEATGQVAGMVIGVLLALDNASPKALVIGQAAGAGLGAAAALASTRHELVLRFSKLDARALLAFTGHVSGQSLVYYAFYTAPSLVISRVFGSAVLGIYSRASVLVTLPTTHLWMGITKTMYPVVSRARGDTPRLQLLIEPAVVGATGLIWPLFAAVAGAAPIVVAALLGSDFAAVSDLLPPILVFGALNLAYVVAGNPLEVLGYQRIIWRYLAIWAAMLAVALGVAVELDFSVESLLWLVAGVQLLIHLLKLGATARIGLLRLIPILRGYGATLLVSGAFFATTRAVEQATSTVGLTGRTVAEVAAVALITSIVVLVPIRTPFSDVVRSGVRLLRNRQQRRDSSSETAARGVP